MIFLNEQHVGVIETMLVCRHRDDHLGAVQRAAGRLRVVAIEFGFRIEQQVSLARLLEQLQRIAALGLDEPVRVLRLVPAPQVRQMPR